MGFPEDVDRYVKVECVAVYCLGVHIVVVVVRWVFVRLVRVFEEVVRVFEEVVRVFEEVETISDSGSLEMISRRTEENPRVHFHESCQNFVSIHLVLFCTAHRFVFLS